MSQTSYGPDPTFDLEAAVREAKAADREISDEIVSEWSKRSGASVIDIRRRLAITPDDLIARIRALEAEVRALKAR